MKIIRELKTWSLGIANNLPDTTLLLLIVTYFDAFAIQLPLYLTWRKRRSDCCHEEQANQTSEKSKQNFAISLGEAFQGDL